jgi:hypothetical protein
MNDPPHAAHIFQVLDVLLFGILKQAKEYQGRHDTLPRDVNHVLRLFSECEQVIASTTNRASWGETGFEHKRRNGTAYPIASEAKSRQTPAVCQAWGLADCIVHKESILLLLFFRTLIRHQTNCSEKNANAEAERRDREYQERLDNRFRTRSIEDKRTFTDIGRPFLRFGSPITSANPMQAESENDPI